MLAAQVHASPAKGNGASDHSEEMSTVPLDSPVTVSARYDSMCQYWAEVGGFLVLSLANQIVYMAWAAQKKHMVVSHYCSSLEAEPMCYNSLITVFHFQGDC